MTDSSLTPSQRLDGKVVMVTGASAGIGRELCFDLARAGCRVVAAARRIEKLKSLCDEINGLVSDGNGARVVWVDLDVSSESSVIETAVQRAWKAFGHIDALVNNAGIRDGKTSPLDWPVEIWEKDLKTNLTGQWLVSKHLCKSMGDAKKKGSIINISSIGGLQRGHLPGQLSYAVSKTALNALTKVMALELGALNIRVNSIAPGLFESEITAGLMKREWLGRVSAKTIPLRTSGTINPALTSLVRYLIHESSEYVTGNVFIVDAGATLPGVPIFSSL